MFEDLDWKGAVKRAAFAALLYLLFVYLMSTAFPDSFGAGGLSSALIVAALFFLLYVPLFAFADRRKRRRLAQMKAQKKGKTRPGGSARATNEPDVDEEDEARSLRGRHNPNTSRRKATRRRRR